MKIVDFWMVLNPAMCLIAFAGLPGGLAAWQTSLRGTVVDSTTGMPIGGVRVVVSPVAIEVFAMANGSFTVGPLRPGAYEIQFEIHRYQARAFSFTVDAFTGPEHDIGLVRLAPAESLLFDIEGLVRDAETAIAGATVAMNHRVLAVTGGDGAFEGQMRLPTGLNVVEGRAVGFAAATRTIWLDREDTLVSVNIVLEPLAVRLEDIVVEGDAVDAKLAVFHEHRLSEHGHFLYGEALDRARRFAVTDLLGSIPGVHVTPGENSIRLSRAPSTPFCMGEQPQFFVDGRPIRLGRATSINAIVEQGDVVAVEVYNGAAEVPVVYNRGNAVCGVVAIWTR